MKAKATQADGGMFAIGLFLGGLSVFLLMIFLSKCDGASSSLWFCDESPETVVAVLELLGNLAIGLAWPIAIVVIGLIFRGRIDSLLRNVTRIKAPGLEAEFSALVSDAENKLEQSNIDPNNALPDFAVVPDRILQYLEVDSKFAVIAAWIEIERKLNRLAKEMFGDINSRRIPAFQNDLLKKMNIPLKLIEAMQDLSGARNTIVHAEDVNMSKSSVMRYLEIAAEIDRFLDERLLKYKDSEAHG